MRTRIYTLPESWAVYLINADSRGYEESELEAIDAFMAAESLPSPADVSESLGFVTWHDAREHYPYAAECADYVFLGD